VEARLTERVNKAAPILALVVLRMAVVGQTPDWSLLVPIVLQFLAIPSSSRPLYTAVSETACRTHAHFTGNFSTRRLKLKSLAAEWPAYHEMPFGLPI